MSDASARARMAHATGRGPIEQQFNGMFVAAERASRPVDWSNPTDTLRHHSQVDATDATRGDVERCGATALVGGLVMAGPEAPTRIAEARTRLSSRLEGIDRGLMARETREWSRPDATAFGGMSDAREAHRMLDSLPADTSTWTHEDLSRFEEATYRTGRADMALRGERTGSGLTAGELRSLRDTMWGEHRPTTADGHPVDVIFAGSRSLTGDVDYNHFVLGTDDGPAAPHMTVYDPWPAEDGTNFVRTPGAAERPLGGRSADSFGVGPRPGVDIDAIPVD